MGEIRAELVSSAMPRLKISAPWMGGKEPPAECHKVVVSDGDITLASWCAWVTAHQAREDCVARFMKMRDNT